MPLDYKAFQSVLATKEGERLWYPTLVKHGTVTTNYLARRIAEKSSLTPGDIYNVVDGLISEMNDKLMNGLSVNLEGLGTFTAIIKAGGKGVKTPEEVNASQIKTMNIRFTPSYKRTPMQGTTRALYSGVEFKRWSGDPYNPKNKPEGNKDNTGNGDDNDDPTA